MPPQGKDAIAINRGRGIGTTIIEIGPNFTLVGVFPHGLARVHVQAEKRVSIILITGDKEPTFFHHGT